MGKRHTKIIQELYPEIIISALRHSLCDDIDINTFGLHDCFTELKDALAFKPDVAILASPATRHLETAKVLASDGIHLLIEKPISSSSEGVQSLIDLCYKNKIILMTGYNLRFLPTLVEFRRQLHLEKVGKILSVHAEVGQYLPSWRIGIDYRKTVSAQKDLGGGALLELSHEIDYLSWIFGPIKWVKSHISKQSNLEIDVEDTVNTILGFEVPIGNQITASLSMDIVRHDSTRRCTAIGETGSLHWDGIAGEVKYFPEKGKKWEMIISSKPMIKSSHLEDSYLEEIKHFFASIEKAVPPLSSGVDGLNTLIVIEAIHKSNNNGCVVYI
jgi:predicted dehydrogenase